MGAVQNIPTPRKWKSCLRRRTGDDRDSPICRGLFLGYTELQAEDVRVDEGLRSSSTHLPTMSGMKVR